MSLETSRWTELTQDQAAFFGGHLLSARQTAFSPTAHEAGIVPLNAKTYAIRIGEQTPERVIMWPDPTEPMTACFVTGNANTNANYGSFVRVGILPGSYDVEGVVLGLNFGRGSNLYGHVVLSRHDLQEDVSEEHVGASFLHAARKESEIIQKKASMIGGTTLVGFGLQRAEISGIEGATTATLFRSLSSLTSNMIITGAANEKGSFSNEAYDLAHTLLKMVVRGAASGQTVEDGAMLIGANGTPNGAVFESEEGEIIVMQRAGTYPDAITMATAKRPGIDDETILLEQHTIRARGITFDLATLPADAYGPHSIVNVLGALGMSSKKMEEEVYLDQESTQTLKQKLIRILSEKASKPWQ